MREKHLFPAHEITHMEIMASHTDPGLIANSISGFNSYLGRYSTQAEDVRQKRNEEIRFCSGRAIAYGVGLCALGVVSKEYVLLAPGTLVPPVMVGVPVLTNLMPVRRANARVASINDNINLLKGRLVSEPVTKMEEA